MPSKMGYFGIEFSWSQFIRRLFLSDNENAITDQTAHK